MNKAYPLRVESHQLEELSRRFFERSLPKTWTAEKPENDYGVDLRVDIYEGKRATGLELLIQLKASAKPSGRATEDVQIRTSTYNLLWDKLQVAMLVKYIERDDEAYWLFFRDIRQPRQNRRTFTVHIPRDNRLSAAPWEEIQEYVRRVTDTKRAAMRREQLEQTSSGAGAARAGRPKR